jgi:hypothetical protein
MDSPASDASTPNRHEIVDEMRSSYASKRRRRVFAQGHLINNEN